ncbi:ATP-binding protein [Bacillaceae bacterium W0354]
MDETLKKIIIKDNSLDISPPYLEGEHPIEYGKYLIDTLEINELDSVIRDWLEQRLPGGLVYGDPRLGKSYAINYLERLYENEDSFQVFRFNCQKFARPNENNFFEFLLRDIKHAFYNRGKANAKRDRLFKYLLERGDNTKRKQLLLFIDDAQRLTEIEFDWLMDLFNELDRYGITLTSILVGQEELKYIRSTYIESGMKQIVGRFMVHQYKFQGITSFDSLNYLLAGYDYATDYPVNSGWSYTRYFFPVGFSMGFRLENFTDQLWDAFVKINKDSGLRNKVNIPMYYIISIINYLLRKYGKNGEGLEWISMNHWKESIELSGYKIYQGINYGKSKNG